MRRRLEPRADIAIGLVSLLLVAAGCKPSVSIQNKGSDTMLEIAQAWAFNYDKASVEVSGGGSGVGISALIGGTVDIANCSRAVTAEEIEKAKENTGKEPVEFIVGYDALAVYVHKDNPLEEITIEQLAEIFGRDGKITKWSQLGVEVPGCEEDKIVVATRQNSSGTYIYFKEAVLGEDGEYRLNALALSGSLDLVQSVGSTPCAIGYSGMGYKTDAVKYLKIKKGDGPAVAPSLETTLDKSYPIARPLYMYTLGEPTGPTLEYLQWVRSDAGEEILKQIGYVPLEESKRTHLPEDGE